ncbi:MAG: glycosyltransferase family 39 protein [Acidobacteriota bacterium]
MRPATGKDPGPTFGVALPAPADLLRAVLLAGAVLLFAAVIVDVRRVHLSAAGNDQISYISVARNFVEHGRLFNNPIYPLQLLVPATKDYFYMPGYYWALAASFSLFGFGGLQAHLPSGVSFLLAALAVFVIAFRIHDRSRAFLALGLFLTFPSYVLSGCSAMSDMSVAAVTTVALLAFLFLPVRLRPWLGPFLIVPAFLFRETSALLAVPMAVLLLGDSRRRNALRLTAFLATSLAALGLVCRLDAVAGRPGLLKANLLDGSFQALYNDAFRVQALRASAGDWTLAALRNIARNAGAYFHSLAHHPLAIETLALTIILGCMTVALWRGVTGGSAARFELASGLFTAAMLAFLLVCYDLMEGKGVRLLLATGPLLAVTFAGWVYPYLRAENGRWRRRSVALAAGAGLFFFAATVAQRAQSVRLDRFDRECLTFHERVGHDSAGVLKPIVRRVGIGG